MKKIHTLCLSFWIIAMLGLAIMPTFSWAANGCFPLYNGGVTDQQYCPTPTPQSDSGTLLNTQVTPFTTRGGQRIYPAPNTKTTPSTGPEAWSLPALFVIGAMGFLLINKAKT